MIHDYTGVRYGRLVAIAPHHRKGKITYWLCRCDCGNEKVIRIQSLNNGATKSCGCLHRELLAERNRKHGFADSRLYTVWLNMRRRCYEQQNAKYPEYGGRGITVCEAWRVDFQAFYDWAMANGYDENAPYGQCTLDRIDVNGDYCPENCRWATNQDQQNNKRNNHVLTINGETHTISQWAAISGIPAYEVRKRLDAGWGTETAVFKPLQIQKRG